MKALVTGDRGFIGRHFVNFLKVKDWEVYGLDIANGADEDCIPFFVEDTDEQYDLVVHCAYEVGGRKHIDATNMALATNALLDAAMFRWALNGGAKAVIYYSSSAAYPIHLQQRWCTTCPGEGHPPRRLSEEDIDFSALAQPDADYGWAKLTGERIARRAQALGLRVHILRPFSGYGSDQSDDYPFPSIVKRAMRNELEVWGPPGQTRDWIHIDDVIRGSWAIYQQNVQEPVNLCTGVGTEMGDLIQAARNIYQRLTGETGEVGEVTYIHDAPTGVYYRVGDPSKLRQYYVPKISILQGIQLALEDYLGR